MNTITQYRPAYFTGFDNAVVNYNTLTDLFSIEFVRNFSNSETFYRYVTSDDGKTLMVEKDYGYEWWVVGHFKEPELRLPKWVSRYGKPNDTIKEFFKEKFKCDFTAQRFSEITNSPFEKVDALFKGKGSIDKSIAIALSILAKVKDPPLSIIEQEVKEAMASYGAVSKEDIIKKYTSISYWLDVQKKYDERSVNRPSFIDTIRSLFVTYEDTAVLDPTNDMHMLMVYLGIVTINNKIIENGYNLTIYGVEYLTNLRRY